MAYGCIFHVVVYVYLHEECVLPLVELQSEGKLSFI